jgi:hypothetical protein
MFSRLLIAALSLHLTSALIVAIGAGVVPALAFVAGLAYLFAFNVVNVVPFLFIPAMAAVAFSMVAIRLTRHKPRWTAALVGAVSVFVFIVIAELGTAIAMRVTLQAMDEPACMFGTRTFMSSAFSYLKAADLLFGDVFRYEHHAHIALPGERLAIWSYIAMAFLPYDLGPIIVQDVPPICEAIFTTPLLGSHAP